jgi:hypothetical protein
MASFLSRSQTAPPSGPGGGGPPPPGSGAPAGDPPGGGSPPPMTRSQQEAKHEATLMDPQLLDPNFQWPDNMAIRHWNKGDLIKLYKAASRGLFKTWNADAVITDSIAGVPPTFAVSHCWGVKNRTENANVKYNNKSYLQLKLNDVGGRSYNLIFGSALFYWYKTGMFAYKGMEVSHRCHNNRCVNPDHMLLETVANNKARNGCAGHGMCACPYCPQRPHKTLMCSHNPPCMARYRHDEDIAKPVELGMSLVGNTRARE